jgi:hypothetical protein
MWELYRTQKMYVVTAIVVMLSTIAYCAKVNRASPDECDAAVKNMRSFFAKPGAAISGEDGSYLDNIYSQCERHYSSGYAKCLAKARDMAGAKACK